MPLCPSWATTSLVLVWGSARRISRIASALVPGALAMLNSTTVMRRRVGLAYGEPTPGQWTALAECGATGHRRGQQRNTACRGRASSPHTVTQLFSPGYVAAQGRLRRFFHERPMRSRNLPYCGRLNWWFMDRPAEELASVVGSVAVGRSAGIGRETSPLVSR